MVLNEVFISKYSAHPSIQKIKRGFSLDKQFENCLKLFETENCLCKY